MLAAFTGGGMGTGLARDSLRGSTLGVGELGLDLLGVGFGFGFGLGAGAWVFNRAGFGFKFETVEGLGDMPLPL